VVLDRPERRPGVDAVAAASGLRAPGYRRLSHARARGDEHRRPHQRGRAPPVLLLGRDRVGRLSPVYSKPSPDRLSRGDHPRHHCGGRQPALRPASGHGSCHGAPAMVAIRTRPGRKPDRPCPDPSARRGAPRPAYEAPGTGVGSADYPLPSLESITVLDGPILAACRRRPSWRSSASSSNRWNG